MQPRPTWWLVIIRPSGETNEPEPPSLNRTEASRTLSSHAGVGVKPYTSFNRPSGGLSNVHIPSSATTGATRTSGSTKERERRRRIKNDLQRLVPSLDGLRLRSALRSAPGLDRDEVSPPVSQEHLAGPGDLLILVLEHLLPLGQPAGGPRDREQHREQVHREAHGLVDEP